VFDLATEINRGRDVWERSATPAALLLELAGVLGLRLRRRRRRRSPPSPFIELLLTSARVAAKQYAIADTIPSASPVGVTWEDPRRHHLARDDDGERTHTNRHEVFRSLRRSTSAMRRVSCGFTRCALSGEPLVVTEDGMPIAVLIPVSDIDLE
jgi:hypothetical protein